MIGSKQAEGAELTTKSKTHHQHQSLPSKVVVNPMPNFTTFQASSSGVEINPGIAPNKEHIPANEVVVPYIYLRLVVVFDTLDGGGQVGCDRLAWSWMDVDEM